MPNIFISYRRDDSSATAQILHDQLAAWFVRDKVFLDLKDIALGENWRKLLTERLGDYDIVLVVIGPAWLAALAARLKSGDDDLVHWEVAEALRRRKRVIPVLVDGASLPAPEQLPPDLAELGRLQVETLHRDTRDRDIAALAAALEGGGLVDFVRKLKQVLRLGKAGIAVTVVVGAAALSFAWVNLFDLLGLDTRSASFTMLLGDVLVEPVLSDRLLLVAITPHADETTRLSSTRRTEYTRLISIASARKAEAIAFDITTDEASAADAALIDAVRAARRDGTRVVFGFKALTPAGEPVALPGLAEAGAALGLTCIGQKLDNAVLGTLAMRSANRVYGSYALHAVADASSIAPIPHREKSLSLRHASGESSVPFSLREVVDRSDRDCPARPAGAELARLIFPVSHRERLRDAARRIDAENLLAAPPAPGSWQGKIVVVGVTHPLDVLQTRLDSAGPQRYGFEFQADAVNALLTGAIVTPLGFLAQWLLSLAMALAAIAYRLWRVGKSRRLDLLVLPLAIVAYLGVMVLLYAKFGLLVDGLYHLAAFVVTWWVLAALEKRWSHASK
ncbi:MAG: CHASE2 domain-containing protein [Dechloromonas sp.]|nr:CHASE2 domain-containing protein [Dechloromonas sp.]